MTAIYVLVAVGVLIALWAIVTYNTLIRVRNRLEESWSGIDVQLKRRRNLVPNLVETVKGYARHERKTLTAATEARAAAAAASGRARQAGAESALSAALGEIRAVAEQYPELLASENFRQLQEQLAEIEDEIQAARRIFNSNVQFYNTRIQIFPNSLLAALLSFDKRDFFEIELSRERAVPEATFA